MKSSFLCASIVALAAQVAAFPAVGQDQIQRLAELQETQHSSHQKRLVFDAKSQYVSTTGKHAFVPPNFANGDVRGPCPGLNALANHGYLPHNGVGSIGDFIKATNEAYGMALDLGTFLAVFGAVFDGNLASWSIGGPTTNVQLPLNNVLGLTGAPQGISGSHNKYESDASPTRGDLYVSGNNFEVQVGQFQQYYDALEEGLGASAQYDKLADFHISRFKDSIENNPNFFFSPFAGLLVSPAGYNFPVRMMSNKSEEFPEGSLSRKDLMSFFSITGESGNFKYTVGHERIPDNWYKRAIGDEYTIPGFLADVISHAEKYPPLLNVGGNTGTKNSFFTLDFRSLTKGVFSGADLLDANNLECFLLQVAQAPIPDILGGSQSEIGNIKKPLSDVVVTRLLALGCPKLDAIDQTQYDRFPGYNKCPHGCSSGYAP